MDTSLDSLLGHIATHIEQMERNTGEPAVQLRAKLTELHAQAERAQRGTGAPLARRRGGAASSTGRTGSRASACSLPVARQRLQTERCCGAVLVPGGLSTQCVGAGGATCTTTRAGLDVSEGVMVQELDRCVRNHHFITSLSHVRVPNRWGSAWAGLRTHRLDQRLNAFESRLAGATPEARALVQAAVEASAVITPTPTPNPQPR
jgi:hypothetical protein